MARRGYVSALAVFELCLLPACAGGGAPDASVAATERAPEPAPTAQATPAVTHTVAEGETLWDIARAYGVSVEAILNANGMRERDVRKLSTGKPLTIPGASEVVSVETASHRAKRREELPELEDGAYHFLARGESLWTLARVYDVPIETLMDRNSLADEDVAQLREGQAIVIPGIRQDQVKKAEARKTREGITHELVRGETVWDIAYSFGVSVAEIMGANALSAQDVTALREGRQIFIPGVEADKRGHVRRRASARESRALTIARRLGLGSKAVAGQLLHGRVEPRWAKAAERAGRFPGTLRWPVAKGWYVRGFGSGEGGYHLAMDIMGEIGWNVRAAAPGIVAYSGNEVRGYGNLVLLVHPGGWVTMYAHNSVNFVVAGESVPRGAILAEVGSTGISRGPHVHFELMYGGKNCDPAPLFRPEVRHRSGKASNIEQVAWVSPGARPREVRCAPRRRHPRSRWVIHEDPTTEAEGDAP